MTARTYPQFHDKLDMVRAYSPVITISSVSTKPHPARPDVRLTILVSFVAGILIGVPLTFGALILGTLSESSRPAVDEKLYRSVVQALSPQQNIRKDHSFQHSTVSILASIQKSGSRNSKTSGSTQPRGRIQNMIPRHASDLQASDFGGDSTVVPFENLADGILWTDFAESFVPRGFDDEDAKQWRKFLNATDVLKVEEGCGRMQNRLVTLSDGRMSCCRYRHNNDQIQGEIFSFYLGRLLHVDNLSPSALSLVDPRTKRWSAAASQMALARWNPERPAVLTRFIENLQPAFVPKHFRDSKKRRLHPVSEDLGNLTAAEISELVQWSDLVIFDYLTANLDRVVNNMYNERWNPGMMSQPTHNLAKTPEGLLLFLDNESGLLHGYRLLEKYEHFHKSLLNVTCMFRKKTVLAIEKLYREDNVDTLLKQAFSDSDPGMSEWLPFLPDRSVRTLKERIAQILQQVQRCRLRFESNRQSHTLR